MTVEVYPIFQHNKTKSGAKARGRNAGRALLGYRFRFIKPELDDPVMLVSERLYDSAERAAEVATILNRDCFAGAYTLRKVRKG